VSDWLSAHDDQSHRRVRRPEDQRASLRSLTIVVAVAAAALNCLLFAQTAFGSITDVGNAALGLLNAVLPAGTGGIQSSEAPSPAPGGARPVVVSGGS
jgi:hypothetical protein